MSFQGDVGGIGLADLLQSLARGRDGVLTLHGKDGLRCTLGIQEGLVHLLPDPEEDPEYWRNRARQAWVRSPDFQIDSLRMVEIARAQRLETLYSLLDSEGVHFRFLPGQVPHAPEPSAGIQPGESGAAPTGPRRDAVYVAPAAVEGLLLEYARLKDEGMGAGPWHLLSQHVVLRRLDDGVPPQELARFLEQCDGDSNQIELADRLGWSLRQVKILALTLLSRGVLRFATPDELLLLAQSELVQTNCERAASRLVSWIDGSRPGPLAPEDARVLAAEWEAQRLQSALPRLPLDAARALVQRLARTIGEPLRTVELWAELARIARHDTLVELHLLVAQIRAGADLNVPSFKGLLEVAHGFQEGGHPLRAASILRIAAGRQPAGTDDRLALGSAMLAAGQAGEAAPWILEACRTLLEAGRPEAVLDPLRLLVDHEPGHREARRLLSRARAASVRRTLVKKNSLVTMAVVLALSVGAVVQYRSEHSRRERVDEIQALMEDPRAALALLEQYFPGEQVVQVANLRETILAHKKSLDSAERSAWTDRYREAQLECTVGDLLLGLERALEVPRPPTGIETTEPWPLASDLYNGLSARVENSLVELGTSVEDTPAQVHAEERLLTLIRDLVARLAARELPREAKEFLHHLQVLEKRVVERGETRASARAALQRRENLARQDVLLAAARAHAGAGDFARALQSYTSLLESDASGRLKELLANEVAAASERLQAVEQARKLCLSGQHAEARALLTGALENPGDYLLPWRVESSPSGAHVRLTDGSVRSTPFTLETTLDEAVTLRVEAEGYEPRTLDVNRPGDQFIHLSRLPERDWPTGGRVDALPVAVGDDHVVSDRDGRLTRLGRGGPGWAERLSTLGGIARAPVFLPRRAGCLLVLSEDGEAWVVDTRDGRTEGPWNRNVAPIAGPYVVGDAVLARFRDGSVWRWREQSAPEPVDPAEGEAALAPFVARGLDHEHQRGLSPNFSVLRRSAADANELPSPWNSLVARVSGTRCTLAARGEAQARFSVDLEGEWTYIAFESPDARAPQGRLWISDAHGLRSFVP